MRIFTSRFANKGLRERPDLVKVCIAVGSPRWRVGYEWVKCRCLAPYGLRKLKGEQFQEAYLANLDALGVEPIRTELEKISEAHGGKDLVLLCYENLSEPGLWCHRSVFADWWWKATGQPVFELEADPAQQQTHQMGLC